jgi:hypothetical protein
MARSARGPIGVLILLAPVAVAAQEGPPAERYGLRAEYREWRPKLGQSQVQNGTGSGPGTLLDVQDDLGVEDERTFEVRATLQFKRGHKIRGSYTKLDFDGDVIAGRQFTFDDSIYRLNSRVVTSIKGGYYSAEYEWDLVKRERGFLGVTIGAKVFDVDAVLVAPVQGLRETDTLRLPIPVIGIAGRTYYGRMSVQGEISGLTIGKRGYLYEVESSVRVHISDRLAIGGGVRRLSLNGEDEPDLIKIQTSGWHFGAELSL